MTERSVDPALVSRVETELGCRVVDAVPLAGGSPRSTVLRLSLEAPLRTASTIVAKQVRAADRINQPSGVAAGILSVGASAEREATARYSDEVAAYDRLRRAGCSAVPELLAAIDEVRVMILEDVSGRELLDDLWGDDVGRAYEGWVALAEALADVHAAGMAPETVPTAADLEQAWAGSLSSASASAVEVAAATGVPERDLEGELTGLHSRLTTPGPLSTWLHGDPCPGGNVLLDGRRARLVDLEAARPGHAVLEAAYLRCGFPTCWSVGAAGPAALEAAEDAYRRTLQAACPAIAEESAWLRCLADACVWWALDGGALVQRAERETAGLVGRALAEDWEWGTATARQRLALRAAQAADLLAVTGHAPGLKRLMTATVSFLDDLKVTAAPAYPTLAL